MYFKKLMLRKQVIKYSNNARCYDFLSLEGLKRCHGVTETKGSLLLIHLYWLVLGLFKEIFVHVCVLSCDKQENVMVLGWDRRTNDDCLDRAGVDKKIVI